MRYLEDLKLKHIAALIGNEIGKKVHIIDLYIDEYVDFQVDEDGNEIEGTAVQFFSAFVREDEGKPELHVSGVWRIYDEEMGDVEVKESAETEKAV